MACQNIAYNTVPNEYQTSLYKIIHCIKTGVFITM
jgi:hypothetical protein